MRGEASMMQAGPPPAVQCDDGMQFRAESDKGLKHSIQEWGSMGPQPDAAVCLNIHTQEQHKTQPGAARTSWPGACAAGLGLSDDVRDPQQVGLQRGADMALEREHLCMPEGQQTAQLCTGVFSLAEDW